MDMRGRVEALLRDVEKRKIRNPRIEAAIRARDALFVPYILSSNGALGTRAKAFPKLVFSKAFFCCLDSPGAHAQQTRERKDEHTLIFCFLADR